MTQCPKCLAWFDGRSVTAERKREHNKAFYVCGYVQAAVSLSSMGAGHATKLAYELFDRTWSRERKP